MVIQSVFLKLFPGFAAGEHQFFHFLFIFFFFFQVEHGTEHMVPQGGTYAKAPVFIFIMMQVVIAPQSFHPPEWRIPGMDRIVHGSVDQVSKHEAGEE